MHEAWSWARGCEHEVTRFWLLVAIFLATTSCSNGPDSGPLGPDIELGGAYGVANSTARAGVSYSYGGILICSSDPRVVLDRVAPADTTGTITLEAVGVREADPAQGGIETGPDVPLPDEMRAVKGFRVTTPCDDESVETVTEVAVQVKRGKGTSELVGLRMNYHVGNKKYEEIHPFVVTLCDSAELATQAPGDINDDCVAAPA
jgi:hypothetical protein